MSLGITVHLPCTSLRGPMQKAALSQEQTFESSEYLKIKTVQLIWWRPETISCFYKLIGDSLAITIFYLLSRSVEVKVASRCQLRLRKSYCSPPLLVYLISRVATFTDQLTDWQTLNKHLFKRHRYAAETQDDAKDPCWLEELCWIGATYLDRLRQWLRKFATCQRQQVAAAAAEKRRELGRKSNAITQLVLI